MSFYEQIRATLARTPLLAAPRVGPDAVPFYHFFTSSPAVLRLLIQLQHVLDQYLEVLPLKFDPKGSILQDENTSIILKTLNSVINSYLTPEAKIVFFQVSTYLRRKNAFMEKSVQANKDAFTKPDG